MKDIFYQELRNRVQEIKEIEKDGMSGELYHISRSFAMILYTSDMHFGHFNVIKFDQRPFSDIDSFYTSYR